MTNKSKKILLVMMLSCSVAVLASGCDKLKKEPQTETQAPTEAVTEAPTETETETETEPVTEAPTETETETETQPKELTVDEELAQKKDLDAIRTVYATDDINVRTQPGKDAEIFESFDQGETIKAVGETPNWYVVDLEDYEDNGYVAKEVVSEQEVAPKTEEERAQLANGGSGETATDDGTDAAEASANAGGSSVDVEYGVESYAEAFPVRATAGANMRQTPAQDGEIINTIASGTDVKAIGYTDRWYKVEYDGAIGYVNKNLFAAE